MQRNEQIKIPFTGVLANDGRLLQTLPAWATAERLTGFYKALVLARVFDKKAVALQRTGQLGTYASCLGQEAIGVAIGHMMSAKDVFVPYYRDHAAQLLRGVTLTELLLYWGGDERGNAFQNCLHDLPNAVPIATQCAHAAGIATAIKVREERTAVVCTCGDGATSRGDFLESINLAGVWQLPVVYVVNNNQWAISVPRELQSAAPTLAHKALGAGLPGEQVDGNDVIAMAEVLGRAIERAREGKGATLIEAITYRLSDHTTADDASRYRNQEEVHAAWENEPVSRLRAYLYGIGAWSELQEKALYRDCEQQVASAVEAYLAMPSQPPEAMFEHLYAELPAALQEQRNALIRARGPAS